MNSFSLAVSNPLLHVKCFFATLLHLKSFHYTLHLRYMLIRIILELNRLEQLFECVCVAYRCCCKWPIRMASTVLFVVSHLIITIARQYDRFLLCALCDTQVITWYQHRHRHRHRHQHRHYRSIKAVTI